MTTPRKTLGVSRAGGSAKADATATFVPSRARLDRLKERARELRRNPGEAQQALWERLSASQLGGVKFIRQAVVGSAIVDFACPSRWIVVQISPDGSNAEVGALQDRKLIEVGIRVLRFPAGQVLGEPDAVCEAILAELNQPFDRKAAAQAAGQAQARAFAAAVEENNETTHAPD